MGCGAQHSGKDPSGQCTLAAAVVLGAWRERRVWLSEAERHELPWQTAEEGVKRSREGPCWDGCVPEPRRPGRGLRSVGGLRDTLHQVTRQAPVRETRHR